MNSMSSRSVQWGISSSDNGIERQRNLESRFARSGCAVENLVDDPARGCRRGLVIQLTKGWWFAIDYRKVGWVGLAQDVRTNLGVVSTFPLFFSPTARLGLGARTDAKRGAR